MRDCSSLFIDNKWSAAGGEPFASHNPFNGEVTWQGAAATPQDVDCAVTSAVNASLSWGALPLSKRKQYLVAFAELLKEEADAFAEAIALETGHPLWEARGEVLTMINKVAISIEAYELRCPELLKPDRGMQTLTRHKPHGVLAILGPFNFPGHIPNGHIVPALLAGNTIVFKPSELTPYVAVLMAELWKRAGLPAGVLNVVQGKGETGATLARHRHINGLLFTGSWHTGSALAELFSRETGKLLALEMGGNNPLLVWHPSDYRAAAYHTIQSAYMTSGQRCTCARRLLISDDSEGEIFLRHLTDMIAKVKVGAYSDHPEPFMGPLTVPGAVEKLLKLQDHLLASGAEEIVPLKRLQRGENFISPGILDVTKQQEREDEEYFGPLLRLIRVGSFEEAIGEANNTGYGLVAGLLGGKREHFEAFYNNVRAGVINWNVPTTGATSYAPFGGLGKSGNLRPTAFYAADYCAYPVASTEKGELSLPQDLTPGVDLSEIAP